MKPSACNKDVMYENLEIQNLNSKYTYHIEVWARETINVWSYETIMQQASNSNKFGRPIGFKYFNYFTNGKQLITLRNISETLF